MAEVIHRYIGKNNGKRRTPEREVSEARLVDAKVKEREFIAKLREMEYRRKRGELCEQKVFQRINAFAFTVFKEHERGDPTATVRLVERTLRGKYALDATDRHALKMAFDARMRQRLTELQANMQRVPKEFLQEEAS